MAECLDAIGQGDLPTVADLLMQRFKALESSVTEGGWHTARHLELQPTIEVGLTSVQEQMSAAQQERLRAKLAEARAKNKARP